jgi:hypothetical protein
MTALDDVLDVQTTARPAAPRSTPSSKAAIAYLIASGAVAITIIENVKGCSFRCGTKLDPRAASIHWLREDEAKAVMRKARKIAGRSPDIETATSALHRAATDLRATLTEHAVAMVRAGEAASKLDRYVASLKGTGVLAEFNRAYKRRRTAAMLRGEGFMSYGNAMLRFKRALVPLLMNGGQPAVGQSLLATIFR